MLRYYSYYSVGGYKEFYLGSSCDKFEASYYFSLLPIWEQRADSGDEASKQKVELAKGLPSIEILTEEQSFGFPASGNVLITHGAYSLIYRHLEGDIYALSVRDIYGPDKDETNRDVPYLFIITADTKEDADKLNTIAAWATNNLAAYRRAISSTIGYDVEKNGLRFNVSALNAWIEELVSSQSTAEVYTVDRNLVVRARENSVAVLLTSDSLPLDTIVKEQALQGKQIVVVRMSELLPLDNPKQLIANMRGYYKRHISENYTPNDDFIALVVSAAKRLYVLAKKAVAWLKGLINNNDGR